TGYSNILVQPPDPPGPTISVLQYDSPSPPAVRLTIDTRPHATQPRLQPRPPIIQKSSNVSPTHSGDLDMESYYIYSLFTPLLLLLVQYLNPYIASGRTSSMQPNLSFVTQTGTVHSFHRALRFMLQHKSDVYLDVLDIISHGAPEVRFRGVQILFHFYGRSVGHLTIAEPLPKLGYREELEAWEKKQQPQQSQVPSQPDRAGPNNDDEDHRHIWCPHMFPDVDKRQLDDTGPSVGRTSSGAGTLSLYPAEDLLGAYCKECFKLMKGFGIRCYGCRENMHYNCYYRRTSDDELMLYVKEGGVQKVVSPQFCDVRTVPRQHIKGDGYDQDQLVNLEKQPWAVDTEVAFECARHHFQLVNLFTLVLCISCHNPLWGITCQGYRCLSCNRFVHLGCLRSGVTYNNLERCNPRGLSEADTSITYEQLRSDFTSRYRDLLVPNQQLSKSGFEEISTMLNVLKLQENILHCGISAGCLLVRYSAVDPLAPQVNPLLDQMELQAAIETYSRYIQDGRVMATSFLGDFWGNRKHRLEECILSEEDYLSHLAAMMKCLANSDSNTSATTKRKSVGDAQGRLQVVSNPFDTAGSNEQEEVMPQEMLSTEELVAWVRSELRFRSDHAARDLLQHLMNLGLFERLDGHPVLFGFETDSSQPSAPQEVQCIFPVPFAIDCSYTVEPVLTAIASCLNDINISLNECGMLLLTRRCWPDPFTSQYTLERLVYNILGWIYHEDERLLTIHSEYTSQTQTKLPGVRERWAVAAAAVALASHARRRQSSAVGGGNVYVDTRKMLKDKYLMRWMAAVHEMDKGLFCALVFEQTARIVEEKEEEGIMRDWLDESERQTTVVSEMRSLQRLFAPKASNRFSTTDVQSTSTAQSPITGMSPMDPSSVDIITPLKTVAKLFKDGGLDGLSRGLRWVELLQRGGVGIPAPVLSEFAEYLVAAHAPLDKLATFARLMWYQVAAGLGTVTPRSAVAEIIGNLNQANAEVLRQIDANQIAREEHIKQRRTSTAQDTPSPVHVDKDTAIIACLLPYLHFERLNVRCDLVKGFWALINWGTGIANKDEFISSCSPDLAPSVWKVLTPTYDYLSEIATQLVMRLVSADVRHLHACVHKVFENPNWEVRYQGLDNVYGFFSKLDVAFQRKWLGVLSHLGPVFSYFVASIWDEDVRLHFTPSMKWHFEQVRLKATAYIRSLQALHLRTAFRCWDAYFLIASGRQKSTLVKLMIQLNAIFPDWQVLEWDSLTNALEPNSDDDSGTGASDIVDEYVRPESIFISPKDKKISIIGETPEQKAAEEENLKILMLTLALQMLASNLDLNAVQLSKVKFALVKNMGFRDPERHNIDEWKVQFGDFVYTPDDVSQMTMVISCVRGMKKVLDNFIPMTHDNAAAVGSEIIDTRQSTQNNPGAALVDVVLKLFNSGVDLTSLSHLMLKAWLELVLILVYKHNIMDRQLEDTVISCMKQIAELLTKDISEENKLLILEIFMALLKRSDHLTAMVLSRQIMALGKLMTKLKSNTVDPVFIKSKMFLKAAFLRFAMAGLFMLVFKNQAVSDENNQDVELFYVLRTVIDPEDVVMEEGMTEPIYLRDQPVRDVLEKLLNQQMEKRAFSTVLFNMNRYVELVHSKPYSESVLIEYGNFLERVVRLTQEWKRTDWDVNAVLSMSAILMKEHPYDAKGLLPHIKILLKHAIHHCIITPESMVKLLAAYASVSEVLNTDKNSIFGEIIIEELKSTLRGRTKINRDTMLTLLQVWSRHGSNIINNRVYLDPIRLPFLTHWPISIPLQQLVLWDNQPSLRPWFKTIEDKMHTGSIRDRTSYFANVATNLLEDIIFSLEAPPGSLVYSTKEYKVGICASQLAVAMCIQHNDLLTKILTLQRLNDPRRTTRMLNWFLLALARCESNVLITKAFDSQINVTDFLVQTLYSTPVDFTVPDVNFAYTPTGELLSQLFLLVKIWSVLYAKALSLQDEVKITNGQRIYNTKVHTSLVSAERKFWNAVWPPVRSLLMAADIGNEIVAGGIGPAIWVMFLDLIEFLQSCRSDIIMIYSQEWCALLDGLSFELISIPNFESNVRAARQMFEVPPTNLKEELLSMQLLLELREGMRIQAEAHANQGVKFLPQLGGLG
ncbi:hypothetical protein BC936DRAFT_148508, partial [Jimgerdemannia flammicorona]